MPPCAPCARTARSTSSATSGSSSTSVPNKPGEFPFWLAGIVAIGLALGWQIVANHLYREIFAIVAQGISITLLVTVVSFVTATALGLLLAIGGASHYRIVRECCRGYIEVIRGVPVLVLLFYIAFVGAQLMVDGANWLTTWPQGWGWM